MIHIIRTDTLAPIAELSKTKVTRRSKADERKHFCMYVHICLSVSLSLSSLLLIPRGKGQGGGARGGRAHGGDIWSSYLV